MIKSILRNIYMSLYNELKRPSIKSVLVSKNANIGRFAKVENHCIVDAQTTIGKYTFIGPYTTITKTNIGNYCSIASFVKIGHGEHDLTRISTSTRFYRSAYEDLTEKPCIIGNDVWIGTDAIILRGVTIGDGAVIGANAVVTKNVPPFAIVVGAPAKIIKYRFPKEKIKEISASHWWEFDKTDAETIINSLCSK